MENYVLFQPSRLRAVKIKRTLLKHISTQRFFTEDRVRLFGWYIKPSNENSPVFLFFHGQAESVLSHQDIAEFCINNGFGLFLLSYRGHYKSGGQPDEEGTYKDAKAAILRLNELGIETNRIILWGHSYGSVVAVETALNFNINATILHAPIKDFKSAIAGVIKFIVKRNKLKIFEPFLLKKVQDIPLLTKLDNISKISSVNCPLLLMHAKTDLIAPYTNSVELAAKNKNAQLVLSNTGSHWKSKWCFKYIFEFVNSLGYNKPA